MSTSEIGPMLLTTISTSTTAGGPKIQNCFNLTFALSWLLNLPPKSGLTLLSYPLSRLSRSVDMFWWLFFCGVRDIFIRDIAKLSCEPRMVTKNANSGIIEDSMLPGNKFVVSSVYKIFIRRFMESLHKETPFYRFLGFNLSRDKQDFLTANLSSVSGVNELTVLFSFGKSC